AVLSKLAEVVQIRKNGCVRLRHQSSRCQECSTHCPTGAIQVGTAGDEITIEWDKCTGCGICCTVCKTGVYTLKDFSDRAFLGKCREALTRGKGLEIRCKQAGGGAQHSCIEAPCLGIIDPAHLIGVAAYGASALHLRHADCSECSARHGDSCVSKSVAAAESLLRIFAPSKKMAITVGTHPAPFTGEERRAEESGSKPEKMVSRRELFKFFRVNTLLAAAEIVEALPEEHPTPESEMIRHRDFLPERRELLISFLKRMGKPQGKTPDTPSPACSVSAGLEIESAACDRCGMCCHFCPTHALKGYTSPDDAGGGAAVREIRFRASHCVQCDLCLVVCSRKAIRYTDTTDTGSFLEERERSLLAGERKA
ncbi:MAG: hypothetical protein U0411_13805, partial [Thermodesulfovibrionales bacterium]